MLSEDSDCLVESQYPQPFFWGGGGVGVIAEYKCSEVATDAI